MSVSSVGRRVHARGAATENARSPIRRSVLGWKRSSLLEAPSEERDGMLVQREQVGDVVRRLTRQSRVHEETQFVLDSLHDRKPNTWSRGFRSSTSLDAACRTLQL